MQAGIRQIVGTAAAFALALNAALWGIAPTYAALPIDPFAIICHSETPATGTSAPDNLPLAPTHACNHCILCSAAAPPVTPGAETLVADFEPTKTLQVLYPANPACHDHVIADSRSARGPPCFRLT